MAGAGPARRRRVGAPGTGPALSAPPLPADLAAAIRDRRATTSSWWREGPWTYAHAEGPEGLLFARVSDDPEDRARLDHDQEVRATIGREGPLRAPAILARGPTWFLEEGIRSDPWTGPEAMRIAGRAAARLAGLTLPPRSWPVPRAPRGRRLRERLRLVRSRLPLREVLAARRLARSLRLPPVTSHGDFHPGNVFLHSGTAWVVDWELAGSAPAGSDLLQFWATLASPEDRATLFDHAQDLVEEAHHADLRRLRYVMAVRTIANRLTGAHRDPASEAQALALLEELPRLRNAASR